VKKLVIHDRRDPKRRPLFEVEVRLLGVPDGVFVEGVEVEWADHRPLPAEPDGAEGAALAL
jgi:hypothetical protein